MLQSIRDHTQGWIAGIIISLLILSFGLWGIHSYFIGNGVTTSVAEVNGVAISKNELGTAYERMRRQLQMQFSSSYELPPSAEAGLKDRALQALINIQVLKQGSLSQNFRISEQQVDQLLESMPEFQANGQFSLAKFNQVIATTLYTASDFLDLIRTSLLIDQPRLGIIFTSFALPDEVNNSIGLIDQERDVQYAMLQPLTNTVIQISDDKIKGYYQQHLNDYKTPEQVSIDYVELNLNDLANKIQTSIAELKNFYNENMNSFAEPDQWKLETYIIPLPARASSDEIAAVEKKAEDIYQSAYAGNDISAMANPYKQNAAKATEWVTLKEVPVELQSQVMSLNKPGQLSKPIKLENGIALIKVTDYKKMHVNPFESVSDKVKAVYAHQKAEEQFADLREKLANLTYEHPDSLKPAADALGLTIKSSELFTKDKSAKDIASNAKIREAAFGNDVLNLQNNSDILQKNADTAVVLRVKSHIPAALISLDTVKPQIIEKLQAAEMDARELQQANTIKNQLETRSQTANNLTWKPLGLISRHADKINPSILNAAFSLAKPTDNKLSFAVVKLPEGYAIIKVISVRDGNSANQQDYHVYAEQFQNSQGLLEYELYKQSLMSHAKIEMTDA